MAMRLELEDNTFDLAGSQFGVMLFPDLPRGLREMARVTKPGGRVLMNVYGPPASIEFLGFFVAAMQAAVPGFIGLPSNPPPLPFQVADPGEAARELAEAGLRGVRVETITERTGVSGRGSSCGDWVVNSNPIGADLVAHLTDEQRAVVQQALEGMIRERAGGSGPATLTNPIHVGLGTK